MTYDHDLYARVYRWALAALRTPEPDDRHVDPTTGEADATHLAEDYAAEHEDGCLPDTEATIRDEVWDAAAEAAEAYDTADDEDDEDDDGWRREMAMEAGMGLGIDAYNDAMGW